MNAKMDPESRAVRATVSGRVQGVGFRESARRQAGRLGLRGWVRNAEDGTVLVHAEGPAGAVGTLLEFLREGPRGAEVQDVAVEEGRVEGHEQFAIRGVSAGQFVVQEHQATAHHFDLRLQVGGAMRSWAVPKGPSLDPSVKRLAVQVPDHELSYNSFEGPSDDGAVIVWDRGTYEQGGRVPWPEALERGHAVFVLHGHKLRGGFALQRTGPGGTAESVTAGDGTTKGGTTRDGAADGGTAHGGAASSERSQWLLIKRRDEHARPGSDVVAEQPASVLSGRTLGELLR